MITILIGVLLILVYTDIREYRIPNAIVFPAILIGCLLTGFWLQTLLAFLLLAIATKYGTLIRWAGGDVKIIAMVASYVGWMFLPVCILTELLVRLYRFSFNNKMGLPMAPFACLSTVLVITAVAILRIVR